MDDLSQFREALQANDFDRIDYLSSRNSDMLIEAYDSSNMNDKMMWICRKSIDRGHFTHFFSLTSNDSVLSKAIEFNAVELFSILKEYHFYIVSYSSLHEKILKL